MQDPINNAIDGHALEQSYLDATESRESRRARERVEAQGRIIDAPVESPRTAFTDAQKRKLGIGRSKRKSRARYKAKSARALSSALAQVTAANTKE